MILSCTGLNHECQRARLCDFNELRLFLQEISSSNSFCHAFLSCSLPVV